MHRTSPALAAIALAGLLAAGCGGSGPAPGHSAPAAAVVTYADPACPDLLAAADRIDTAQSVTGDTISSLDGIASPGSTLAGLAGGLQGDLTSILFDQSGVSASTAADLAKYGTDLAQVQQFCKGG